MTGKDVMVKANAAWQRILVPDFWAILKGKKHAKDIESLIVKEIDDLQNLRKSIDLGEEKMFKGGMEGGIEIAEKEKKDEHEIHLTNFGVEIEEEKRLKKIDERLGQLKRFAEKKFGNSNSLAEKEIVQEIKELHGLMSEIGSLAQKQAKMDYNLAHGHHAFARFVQLRNIHSVANRLKVLEKKARKDRKSEIHDFDDLDKEFDKALKSEKPEDFSKAVSLIHKELADYMVDAKNEFTDVVDGDQMIALLVDHSIEYMDKLRTLLVEAKDKGYDDRSASELAKKINYELESFHNLAAEFLDQDRASAHGAGVGAA